MKRFSLQEAKKIGDSLGIDWKTINLEEFSKGINVELEHGSMFVRTNVTNDDPDLTAKIAWAHLLEFPDYYTRLEKMEQEAEAYWSQREA